jgi:hypothetical protein
MPKYTFRFKGTSFTDQLPRFELNPGDLLRNRTSGAFQPTSKEQSNFAPRQSCFAIRDRQFRIFRLKSSILRLFSSLAQSSLRGEAAE